MGSSLSLRAWANKLAMVVSLPIAFVACSAEPDVSVGDDEVNAASPDALTNVEAVARAKEWSDAKLQYCWAANGKADPNPACASVCRRKSNAAWDPYRSDCSGLVSWAWGLPPTGSGGRTTYGFYPFTKDITSAIEAKDLRPGDAVNSSTHIMLFKEWIKPGARARFIEEPGCSSKTPHARETETDVKISGTQITLAHSGKTFTAIRYTKLKLASGETTSTPDAESTKAEAKPVASAWAKGALDAADCKGIKGWAVHSAKHAVDVELSFDAALGRPGALVVRTAANVRRSDLPAASADYGFTIDVPLALRDGADHTVRAYAVDDAGNALELANAPKTIRCTAPALPLAAAEGRRRLVTDEALEAWKIAPLAGVGKQSPATAETLAKAAAFPDRPLAVVTDDASKETFVVDGGLRRPADREALRAWRLVPVAKKKSEIDALDKGPAWPAAPFFFQAGGSEVWMLDVALPDAAGAQPSSALGEESASLGDEDGQPEPSAKDKGTNEGESEENEEEEAKTSDPKDATASGCSSAPGAFGGSAGGQCPLFATLLGLALIVRDRRRNGRLGAPRPMAQARSASGSSRLTDPRDF